MIYYNDVYYNDLEDCFQSASNGKSTIAAAITGKGISTSSNATYATMAANINKISSASNLKFTVGFNGHNSNFSSTTPFKYTNNTYKYLKIEYSGYMPVKVTGGSTTIFSKTSESQATQSKVVNISSYSTITCTGSHNGYTMATLTLTFSMSSLS